MPSAQDDPSVDSFSLFMFDKHLNSLETYFYLTHTSTVRIYPMLSLNLYSLFLVLFIVITNDCNYTYMCKDLCIADATRRVRVDI